jgi:hypothetical protein
MKIFFNAIALLLIMDPHCSVSHCAADGVPKRPRYWRSIYRRALFSATRAINNSNSREDAELGHSQRAGLMGRY